MTRSSPILPTTARRIAVVGCGHVGLVMAAGFAELGNHVWGIDRDKALIDELSHDTIRIKEDGLPELVAKGLASDQDRKEFDRKFVKTNWWKFNMCPGLMLNWWLALDEAAQLDQQGGLEAAVKAAIKDAASALKARLPW